MIMVQDGRQLSETKTRTGSHVLVDYCGASGGDFLRYFISLHEGFEKITWNKEWQEHIPFPNVNCEPKKKIDFKFIKNFENLDEFNLQFKKEMPNEHKYRQCYKLKCYKAYPPEANKNYGHSTVGTTHFEDDAIIFDRVFKWDYSDYEFVRQTNHKIVFNVMNPFSKYKDFYLKRHALWSGNREDYDSSIHEACWKRNYLKDNYPKHKLNYELEINDLLDYDDTTYDNLIKFLDVKPLDNWKEYIEEYKHEVIKL